MAHTILIVEDRPDTRNMMSFALKKEGYNIIEAEDGQSAVKKINAHSVDLVLLDLMLPEISGKDVLKHIRAKKDNDHIKVIIFTASKLSASDMADFKKNGANGFLLKPVNLKEVSTYLKKLLK